MEIRHTLEILTKDIQDIEKLVGNLQNSPEGSSIEMDLALSKLRNVYEVLTMIREDRLHLRTESRSATVDEPIPQHSGERPQNSGGTGLAERPEPITGQAGSARKESATAKDTGQKQEQETVKTGPARQESATAHEAGEKQDLPGSSEPAKGQEKSKKEAAILAEKFSTESSINENLANKRGDDMDSKLKGQPIENISRNIGINDRFFIIRELFDGDAIGFRSLVDRLDAAGSFEDAYQIIGERFSDSMDHEGVGILIHLAKRRFTGT